MRDGTEPRIGTHTKAYKKGELIQTEWGEEKPLVVGGLGGWLPWAHNLGSVQSEIPWSHRGKIPSLLSPTLSFPPLAWGFGSGVRTKFSRSFSFHRPLCLLQYLVLDMAGLRVLAKQMDRNGFDMCWPILSNQVEKQSLKIVYFATYHT